MPPLETEGVAAPAPAPTPAPTPAPEPIDEFAAMFDHLAAGGDPNDEPGTPPAPAPTPAPAAPEPTPAPTPAPEPALVPEPTPAPTAAPAPAPTAAPAPAPTAAPAYELYTAAEKTELADLTKEWPDIDKLISLKARQLQLETLTLAFQEMKRLYEPVAAYVESASSNDHANAIYEAHPDYDALYAPMQAWIGGQTGWMKNALENVAKEGTSKDVADMVQRFKTETGWKAAAAPAAPAPAPAAPAPAPTLSEAARKAAGTMGVVAGKRGVPPQAADPQDFESAWSEATQS